MCAPCQPKEASHSKLRGILRNSPKLLPSFTQAMESSPRLHPHSNLQNIRRRRMGAAPRHVSGKLTAQMLKARTMIRTSMRKRLALGETQTHVSRSLALKYV